MQEDGIPSWLVGALRKLTVYHSREPRDLPLLKQSKPCMNASYTQKPINIITPHKPMNPIQPPHREGGKQPNSHSAHPYMGVYIYSVPWQHTNSTTCSA